MGVGVFEGAESLLRGNADGCKGVNEVIVITEQLRQKEHRGMVKSEISCSSEFATR